MEDLPIRLNMKKIENFCKKYHVIYLALFGSVLTSKFTEKSDIDFLVKFEQKHVPDLFSIVSIESELSDIVGRQVDLRTPGDLSHFFRDEVLAHAKVIYGN